MVSPRGLPDERNPEALSLADLLKLQLCSANIVYRHHATFSSSRYWWWKVFHSCGSAILYERVQGAE
jgi:hypothetical protein